MRFPIAFSLSCTAAAGSSAAAASGAAAATGGSAAASSAGSAAAAAATLLVAASDAGGVSTACEKREARGTASRALSSCGVDGRQRVSAPRSARPSSLLVMRTRAGGDSAPLASTHQRCGVYNAANGSPMRLV